jgi:hypothetical protein
LSLAGKVPDSWKNSSHFYIGPLKVLMALDTTWLKWFLMSFELYEFSNKMANKDTFVG